VAMLRDPGHGFGAAAIQCAMGQRFNSALDRMGNPVAATTPPILVRFSR
jgi:periplasmic protein TonB